MALFIAVIIILVVLCGFFFFIFRGITIRLGKFAQINILRQAGIYDELILHKEQNLEEIQKRIADAAAAEAHAAEQLAGAPAPVKAPDYLALPHGDYKDPEFASEYRAIRDNFVFDRAACVREVLAEHPAEERAGPAGDILADIDLDTCYQLATLPGAQQAEILREAFSAPQQALMDEYTAVAGHFETFEFLTWLREYVFRNSGEVRVRTSLTSDNFNALDARVKTEVDASICEGIYVVAKGKIHDFSIRNREIVG